MHCLCSVLWSEILQSQMVLNLICEMTGNHIQAATGCLQARVDALRQQTRLFSSREHVRALGAGEQGWLPECLWEAAEGEMH